MIKYFQQRIQCPRCGVYDRKLATRPRKTICDYCQLPADVLQWCKCWSLEQELPWMNQPERANGIPRGFKHTRHWKKGGVNGKKSKRSKQKGNPEAMKEGYGTDDMWAPVTDEEIKELAAKA